VSDRTIHKPVYYCSRRNGFFYQLEAEHLEQDLTRLNLGSCYSCILGQLFGAELAVDDQDGYGKGGVQGGSGHQSLQ
jgi:hypothetical protein